jgi:hypothetical protein
MCGAMPVLDQPVQHRIEVVFGDCRELGELVPPDLSFRESSVALAGRAPA